MNENEKLNEIESLRKRLEEIKTSAKNASYDIPMKFYYDTSVREIDYEEYVLVSKMLEMRLHGSDNEKLYNEYKRDAIKARQKSESLQEKLTNQTIQEEPVQIDTSSQNQTQTESTANSTEPETTTETAQPSNEAQSQPETGPVQTNNQNKAEELTDPISNERRLVEARMKEIEKAGAISLKFEGQINGKKVLSEHTPEYFRLLDLIETLDSNFQNPEASEYNEIRSLTTLGEMAPEKYLELVNYAQQKSGVTPDDLHKNHTERTQTQTRTKSTQTNNQAQEQTRTESTQTANPAQNQTTESTQTNNQTQSQTRSTYNNNPSRDSLDPISEEINLIEKRKKEIEKNGAASFNNVKQINGKKVAEANVSEYYHLLDLLEILDSNFQSPEAYKYNDIRTSTALGKMAPDKFLRLVNYARQQKMSPKKQTDEQNPITPNHEETAIIPEPVTSLTPQNPNKELQPYQQEELIEVVKISPLKWLKKHKKKILITLGLTAITISVVTLLSSLLPALTAAAKASEIMTLTNRMLINSSQFFGANAINQQLLHGGNTVLAQAISALTGAQSHFSAATGVWTFGGETLYNVAASAASTFARASKHAFAMSNLATASFVEGINLLGKAKSLQPKKSQEYKNIKKEMQTLLKISSRLTPEQVFLKNDQIRKQIENSTTLTDEEKKILYKKLNKYRNKSLGRANSSGFIDSYHEQKMEMATSSMRIH